MRRDPADPRKLAPVQLPAIQEPNVSYEGVEAANGLVYVALRRDGLGIYRRDERTGFVRIGMASDLGNTWGVRVRGTTAFVTDGDGALAVVDVANPARPAILGRTPTEGSARGLALDGDMVYVAAGSQLVVVDSSNTAAPRVVGRAPVGGSAIRVDYANGRAFVAAWNDAQVFDVSNRTAPRFVSAARLTRDIGREDDRPEVTSRTLGVAAHGGTLFAGSWHVIHSFRVQNHDAPSLLLPEAVNLVDFGPVSAGQRVELPLTVRNRGAAPLTVFDAATDNPAFTVEPRAMRIAPGQSAPLRVSYQGANEEKASALLRFSSDDPVNGVRGGHLVANQPGVGIGRPLPEIAVDLADGGRWSSTSLQGHVALLAYFATFWPVCSLELPDIDARFWKRYRDKGLVVVGVNPGGRGGVRGAAATDDIAGVHRFTSKLGVTFPVGVEQTGSYLRFAENFRGSNPFPVDVIVDRGGKIAYVAREYDPLAMEAVLDRLLP